MSDRSTDPDVTELLADLTRSLEDLQTEIEPDRRLRLPTADELSRFTSEVAIPGLILVLETNIRVLQLLQRAIRLADGKDRSGDRSQVRDRAEDLSRATLSQLESTLSEVQSAVEGRPDDDETEQLLDEARNLRDQIQGELEERSADRSAESDEDTTSQADDAVDIDVEAELKSIKDNLDDVADGANGSQPGEDDDPGPDDEQPDDTTDPDA